MNELLTINRGSSSLKFAVFSRSPGAEPVRLVSGNIERIGQPDALLVARQQSDAEPIREPFNATNAVDTAARLTSWLESHGGLGGLCAIGHRVVHGGPRYTEHRILTAEVVAELERISPFDPAHLPAEIELIKAFANHKPPVVQVACFDTAFHRTMPRVARILPIPRRYERLGVERYGFHGLSFAYLIEELARRVGGATADGRVILAHLGAGASLAAVLDRKSIDTTMAFTPTAGVPMATRSGDLDPGLVAFFAHTEQMTSEQFDQMVNSRSGLLGVSETTGDVQKLLAAEAADPRAAEALALFCYRVKQWIGAYTAALGGLDALVFSGGIGEHSAEIRGRICQGLECLGIVIDPTSNDSGEIRISAAESPVGVYTIPTDEEQMIARYTASVFDAR